MSAEPKGQYVVLKRLERGGSLWEVVSHEEAISSEQAARHAFAEDEAEEALYRVLPWRSWRRTFDLVEETRVTLKVGDDGAQEELPVEPAVEPEPEESAPEN
jgi:hypothetical protein